MHDFTKKIGDAALYLPALQPMYARNTDEYPLLNYMDENNPIFYYPYTLYSVGHAERDVKKAPKAEPMPWNRGKKTILFGDSGGYQIATGKIKIDWTYNKHVKELQHEILLWLEEVADFSMTLDVPTLALEKNHRHFPTFNDTLRTTLLNLDYFQANRIGKTKFCNVLQGRTQDEMDAWYNAVKNYEFEGWAIAGVQAWDLYYLLRRLIILRDEGRLYKCKWIHVLGMGTIEFAIYATIIKSILKIELSFDSSTPFLIAGRTASGYEDYNPFGEQKLKQIRFPTKFDDVERIREPVVLEAWEGAYEAELYNSDTYPLHSPVFENLTLRETLKERDGKFVWSNYTYCLVMMHNVYVQLDAIYSSVSIYKRFGKLLNPELSTRINAVEKVIREVFSSDTPMEVLKENYKIVGLKTDPNKPLCLDKKITKSKPQKIKVDDLFRQL